MLPLLESEARNNKNKITLIYYQKGKEQINKLKKVAKPQQSGSGQKTDRQKEKWRKNGKNGREERRVMRGG